MAGAKIVITVDADALEEIAKLHRSRLSREECANVDKREEQALAEEGLAGESDWPEY